jgi:hypothetical protein
MKLLIETFINKQTILTHHKMFTELDGGEFNPLKYSHEFPQTDNLRNESYYTTNRQLTIQPL